MKKFWVRFTHWEYWPFSLVYLPVFFYFIGLAIKNRSLFFFTASNPTIDFGGMFGEKKSEIYEIIPKEYLPETCLIPKGNKIQAIQKGLQMGYPIIAKPNIGERGAWVKKIETEHQLEEYVSQCPVDFLLQEFVDYPVELGIFYVRFPNDKNGKVTSIVRKKFLNVTGDGVSNIHQLLQKNERALLTANLNSDFLTLNGERVPRNGETVLIEPIGNHCRGTQFLNDNDQISEQLHLAMDELAKKIPKFHFGRFDLRCQSYEQLERLQNFKIVELNGAGSEPGHVYHPGYPIMKAYKDILWHLRVLSDISVQNKNEGVAYWSFAKGYKKWKDHQRYNRILSS